MLSPANIFLHDCSWNMMFHLHQNCHCQCKSKTRYLVSVSTGVVGFDQFCDVGKSFYHKPTCKFTSFRKRVAFEFSPSWWATPVWSIWNLFWIFDPFLLSNFLIAFGDSWVSVCTVYAEDDFSLLVIAECRFVLPLDILVRSLASFIHWFYEEHYFVCFIQRMNSRCLFYSVHGIADVCSIPHRE